MKQAYTPYTVLEQDLARVRDLLRREGDSPNRVIREALAETAWNGKLLRPAFLLLAGHLGTFDTEKHTALAAAVEMLHFGTPLHDDIIDDSPYRRG